MARAGNMFAIVASTSLFLSTAWGQVSERQLFPFVLPWDDGSPTPIALHTWNDRGSELPRITVGPEGHFVAGGRRLRLLGVNFCFGACFPDKVAAERIAARLAKFGVNVVRFHHMDGRRYPNGILRRDARSTRELDPEALDRLCYFIHCLARQGIYSNLNLLVSRPFNRADGLSAEIESLDWKDRHLVGFFYEPLIRLQIEYATQLLRYHNRYSGHRLSDDPAVAFVEINNENGLVHGWLGGRLDDLPRPFAEVLRDRWNEWLARRYRSTEQLRQSWGVKQEPFGPNLVPDGSFRDGLGRWRLEQHDKAQSRIEVVGGGSRNGGPRRAVRIRVLAPGHEDWHVQFNRPGIAVEEDVPYTLEFWARADARRHIRVGVRQAHAPWDNLGFQRTIRLAPRWQFYRFTFVLSRADRDARVDFSGLGQEGAEYQFAQVRFRRGGTVGLPPEARIERRTVPIVRYGRRSDVPRNGQRDWMAFLYELERAYWTRMRRVLKEQIGTRALITGTIVGCSTPHMMARFDWIDTHAYWQHPVFPGRPWDPGNWYVRNLSMVNARGGTIPRLALRRVFGKPHTVTEYNHPAPNTYSAEAFLLLAAYAAFQDWDAIYAFSYCHRTSAWDARRIWGFFDIDQHPLKMATLPIAAALFRRGDVATGRDPVIIPLPEEVERDLLRTAHAWRLVDGSSLGTPVEVALVRRVALSLGPGPRSPVDRTLRETDHFATDTGELRWSLRNGRGLVTAVTRRTRFAVGYLGDGVVKLGNITVRDVRSLQDGWACVAMTAVQGTFEHGRVLVVLAGYAANKGMRWLTDPWKDPLQATLGRNWGTAPSLVEGVEGVFELPNLGGRVRCWALDPLGAPKENVPVTRSPDGKLVIRVGARYRTIWYLIESH